MATHFARWTLNRSISTSPYLSDECLAIASRLPEHRRTRYLASRTLLAELLLMLYGIKRLPELLNTLSGKPHFADSSLVDFSLAYAGNKVGVVVTTEGRCGLDMELLQTFMSFAPSYACVPLSNTEAIWINNQNDPREARTQLYTLRQSLRKLTGKPESSLNTIQLLPGAGRLKVASEPHVEVICDVEDILVWSCAVSPAIEKLTLWEFDQHKGWQSLRDVQARCRDPNGRTMRFTSMP